MASSKVYVRNLQLTGNATYTISVPKEWARRLNLERGSRVYLEVMQDGSLRVYSHPSKRVNTATKTFELDRGDDPESLLRRIIAAYLAGFSSVTLKFNPEMKEVALNLRRVLESSVLGFNVLSESKSEFTFYTVIDEESMSLSEALRKLKLNVHHMLEDTLAGINSSEAKVLERVIEEDQIVDRLYLLITKQVTSMLLNPFIVREHGLVSAAETPHLFLAARSMERISDHAVLIARESLEAISEGRKIPKWLSDDFRKAIELFDLTGDLLFEPSEGEAEELARRIGSALREIASRKIEDSKIQLLANSIERVLGYSMNIVEAVIDMMMIREYLRIAT